MINYDLLGKLYYIITDVRNYSLDPLYQKKGGMTLYLNNSYLALSFDISYASDEHVLIQAQMRLLHKILPDGFTYMLVETGQIFPY